MIQYYKARQVLRNGLVGLYTLLQLTAQAQPTTTLLGYRAGLANAGVPLNTYIGMEAGLSSTGSANTFIGYQAGRNNQSGTNNVFIGLQSGINNTTGIANLFAGSQSGINNSTGSYNMYFGNGAGSHNATGIGNTAIGDGSAYNTLGGDNNVSIGRYAGINNRSGSSNVFIGVAATSPPNTDLVNAVAIGYNSEVTASNSMVLGKDLNVGIGTSAPATKLEVVSSTDNTSGLRLTKLRNTSLATVLNTNKFLTVNANGDVVLGSTNGSARVGTDSPDNFWQVRDSDLVNTNVGSVVIGPGITKTPAGYRLFVSEGILTEKIKVAVASTAEWADGVLAPSYSLMPLNQVQEHIRRFGHLPGIPSANQMVQQGLDVARMDARLLAKIEELTLHLIRQEQQIKGLQRTVRQLK